MQRRCGAKIQSFGDGAERAVRYLPQEDEIRRSILVSHYSKYGRILAYFLSPIPLTFFKSSALRNGRAAIIREAITGPTPGIIFNSFSVAVLMSILPSSIFSFACDCLGSAGTVVPERLNGSEEIRENVFARAAACDGLVSAAPKT